MSRQQLNRWLAGARIVRRKGSSGLLAEQQKLWDAGLIEAPDGKVYKAEVVEAAWRRELEMYDRLTKEQRDMIKNHRGY